MKLIELFYDGDSYFFTQEASDRPKFNQTRCWSEFDGGSESVSQISTQIITAALENAFGVKVEHLQFETTNTIDRMLVEPEHAHLSDDDLPTAFDAQQDECADFMGDQLYHQDPEALFPRIKG